MLKRMSWLPLFSKRPDNLHRETPLRIRIDNINSVLEPESPQDREMVVELLRNHKVDAPGARYTWAFKSGQWDGRTSLLKEDQLKVTCPTGFLPQILEGTKFPSQLDDQRPIQQLSNVQTTVPLRDYQWKSCSAVMQNTFHGMWWPRGIIRIATGGGKTEVAAALVEMINKPTLFLVHRKDLLHQAAKRFQKYLIPVCMVGDGKNELGKVISEHTVVATIQTLTKRIEEGDQAVLDMLASRECVIVDEAHGIAATLDKGNQYNSMLKLLPNAYIRIGLTATPFMRDVYSNHLLEGSTGKVLVNIPARWLIDHGWLADAKITMVKVPPLSPKCFKPDPGKKTSRYQVAYALAIESYDLRNQAILDRVRILPKPALVLVKTVAHADTLIHMAEKQGIHLPFIYGKTPSKERRKAVDVLCQTKGTLMATGIFDLGIDIPPLKGLILASGGKSQGQSLQRIGRGLRVWAGKAGLEVVDFFDLSQPLLSHSEGRKQLWLDEGYEVSIDESLV